MKDYITETVKYVGVDDTDLDLFESQYIIPNGISYNSYIIFDEKIAIMDSVDSRKREARQFGIPAGSLLRLSLIPTSAVMV